MNPPATLFSAEQIQERVGVMARTIASAKLRPDIAMPILVGGFVFAADLLRALAWEGVALDVDKASEIVEVDGISWTVRRRIAAGPGVYNLGVTRDGTRLVATNKRGQSVSI
ncbi:MAG: hypothetical protein V4601_06175, partial [Pseudomonadota bacterium]